MAYFPMFLDIEGKHCLVVGGGKVALRKVQVLLDFGVHVTVVAQQIEKEIKDLCEYETYGARKIDKVIYNSLENVIIDNIYNGNKDIKISSIMNVELV